MVNYYVRTTGNDGNSGADWDNAFLTLQKAFDEILSDGVSDNITVWIAAGTYDANNVNANKTKVDGTSSYRITITGDVTNTSGDGFIRPVIQNTQANSRTFGVFHDYYTVQDLNFQGAVIGNVDIYNGAIQCIFQRNLVTGKGIATAGDNSKIINNIIRDSTRLLTIGQTADTTLIANNTLDNGSGEGIYIFTTIGDFPSALTVKNNLVIGCGKGMSIVGSSASDALSQLTSDYNNFYNCSIVVDYAGTSYTLSEWQTAQSKDANSLAVDPSFVDYGNNDFRIYYNSPVADKGETLGDVTDDYRRETRTVPYDMGVYIAIQKMVNKQRWAYFGLSRCSDWTEATKQLFKNVVDWVKNQ